jgi:hypothetical protein
MVWLVMLGSFENQPLHTSSQRTAHNFHVAVAYRLMPKMSENILPKKISDQYVDSPFVVGKYWRA